jgi:hypothetical protein
VVILLEQADGGEDVALAREELRTRVTH